MDWPISFLLLPSWSSCLCWMTGCYINLPWLCACTIKYLSYSLLFLTDGFPICWQSCVHCSLGRCSFIIHGVVGFFYPEMDHCWRSWNSFANPCWSRGAVVFFCPIGLRCIFFNWINLWMWTIAFFMLLQFIFLSKQIILKFWSFYSLVVTFYLPLQG